MKIEIETEDLAKYIAITGANIFASLGKVPTIDMLIAMKEAICNDITIADSIKKSIETYDKYEKMYEDDEPYLGNINDNTTWT